MDQLTFQTIIEGGILITLVFFGTKLIAVLQGIATSLNNIDGSVRSLDAKTAPGGSKSEHTNPDDDKKTKS